MTDDRHPCPGRVAGIEQRQHADVEVDHDAPDKLFVLQDGDMVLLDREGARRLAEVLLERSRVRVPRAYRRAVTTRDVVRVGDTVAVACSEDDPVPTPYAVHAVDRRYSADGDAPAATLAVQLDDPGDVDGDHWYRPADSACNLLHGDGCAQDPYLVWPPGRGS